jgi:(p)ppGpp synthase/HD superfamily hydrolase
MINKAKEFAIKHHGEQKYGDRPYSFHLDQVVSYLVPYGETAQVIGYLHDVVEDTDVTLE